MAQRMQSLGLLAQWRCPQLPVSPAQALQLALDQAHDLANSSKASVKDITIVGSSLGGFYAIVLAEQLGCKAVLLNPAVHAPRDLATQIGDHLTYHDQKPMAFLPGYVDELQAMAVSSITNPERYLLIAATGDELLDYKEMIAFMTGAHMTVVQGSDHGLSDFAQQMPSVLSFAGIIDPRAPG